MAELMVAGAFLSSALNVLFDRLASRHVVDFFHSKKLGEGLLNKFKIVLMAVNVLLDDAEMKEFSNPGVKQWLDGLKDVIYHAEDLLDEIYTMATKPKKKSVFGGRSKLKARRVEEIIEKINSFVSQKDLLGLSEGVRDNLIRREPTTSLAEDTFIGRDAEKQKIIESLLLNDAVEVEIPVVAIVGMGGMGKTTLAKMVYNDEKVKEYFPLRAWVCVTETVDIFHITKIVFETVTSTHSHITDLNLLQLKLKQELSEKKILLVLDDVWDDSYSKWRKICAPLASVSSESKIIVTTRNNSVALMMGADSSHPLDQLTDNSSWKLFENHAFGKRRNLDAYPNLEEVGKGIVKKCKGLPLAIKTLAGALRGKDDVKDWEMIMKSEIWDSSSVGKSDILPVLKLSYHYLPANLKRCFTYCSIFPQDYEFVKSELVLLWMAEGFLVDKDNNMEELGGKYFDELFTRSFFQKSSGNGACFVMHDLMNDLAQYVSGEFCHGLQRSESRQISEKVRHFSYLRWQLDGSNRIKPMIECTNLRTFLAVDLHKSNMYLSFMSDKYLRDLLPKLGHVRVLSLARYRHTTKLPNSISILIHLRYLDLSETALKSLPNTICQLYNLQTLLLSNCYNLNKLPHNLGELVNLRHLDISGTSLDELPPQIRKLENLQTLSTFIVGEDNCLGLGELNGLRHLKGSLSIRGLHNVNNVEDVIEANLKEKIGIEQLSFEWGQGIEVSNNHSLILDKLQPGAKLNHLTLVNYGGTCLSNWLGDGSLFNLTYLKIYNCVHCLSLPSLGQLPSLVELHFQSMISVTRVGSDFYGNGPSSVKPFQKLTILKFESMSEWEEWSPSGGVGNDDFPKLETLWIQHCPKLCGKLPKLLPSLRDLCIEGCSELTTIIPRDASPWSLKLEGCKNILFENMSSLSSLISLEIDDLESNSFPSGMMENCTNLEELRIRHWSSLTNLPDGGLPTTLKKLKISYCNNLLEFLPKETFYNYKYLESLKLQNSGCDSMTSFPLGLFPNLKSLKISSLKNLESFSIEDVDDENLKSLQSLRIEECDKLINFPSGGLRTPNLRNFEIGNCKNLKSLPERMNTQLTSLEYFRICDCEEVESFPAGGLPSNLQTLNIMDCKKLMAKRREWDLHTLSSLYWLTIGYYSEIETFPEAEWQLPTSITWLVIYELPNLKTIDANRLPNFQVLCISNCPKVKFNSNLRNTQDLPASFISLEINNCPLMAKQLQSRNTDLIPDLTIDFVRYFTNGVVNNIGRIILHFQSRKLHHLNSQVHQSLSASPYGENYQQQPFGSYTKGGYGTPAPYQPAPQPKIFLPSQAPAPQASFAPQPATAQPTVRPFVPATPTMLRNAEQYQKPTLGCQLYHGTSNPTYQQRPAAASLGPITPQGVSGSHMPPILLGDLCQLIILRLF